MAFGGLGSDIGPSPATSFTIAQLSGDQKVLELQGRALPYRPISFGGKQRAEFTWYPGNPNATMQVLGSQEDETRIEGVWKYKFLGTVVDSAAIFHTAGAAVTPTALATLTSSSGGRQDITTAFELALTAEAMRREGQKVKVTWAGVTRLGLITAFTYSPENEYDIRWEMTFQWTQLNEATYAAAPVTGSSFGDFVRNISAVAQVVQNVADLVSNVASTGKLYVDQVTGSIAGITSAVIDLESTLTNLTLSNIDPATGAQRGAAQANNVIAQFDGLVGAVTAQPSVMFSAVTSAVPTGINGEPSSPLQAYGEVLSVEQSTRNFIKASRQGQAQAAQQRAQLLKQIDVDIIAVFIAPNNGDLREVSTQYYGTPDDWLQIKNFNGLATSKLAAGQTVFVPKLNVTAVRQ